MPRGVKLRPGASGLPQIGLINWVFKNSNSEVRLRVEEDWERGHEARGRSEAVTARRTAAKPRDD